MHGLNLRIALFFAVVLGIAGLCVLTVNHQEEEAPRLPPPRLDHEVAEGFRLWNPKMGVDSVRFESCSVKKRRMGFIALGAFNVLCIKDLVLNLPMDLEEEAAESEEARAKRNGAGVGNELLAGLIPKSLMKNAGLYAKRFSGISVNDFRVNRVVKKSEVVPVFAAEKMQNRGKVLELTNCRVFADDGSTNLVGKAELRLKPVPVLAWNGGTRPLDDLLK